ncbi:RND transporter [Methylosinus sp. R-45379]|uniref:efflux RND transporter permease subunit n=1 Tax=unclassified Methylosinus TaxID=2624500 RepID=UPI000463F1D2|nr:MULTISPECIES: efflux RND transporter permease subunit [unclassified Methylosinus]OAI27851.1 RND transporter [Methylosinus sp. R-45379]TDX61786.1 HAE1 family hydrophobic/amphiphilic exporter-1 [Methylosinus sp. sav-2]
MTFSHFFVERPIFAIVLATMVTIAGTIGYFRLPVTQYPDIVPPTIQVNASFPGASAEVVGETVATLLEEQINGVENMMYMNSQSTGDGRLTTTITFRLGTNLEIAQTQVQNRLAPALARLPEEVRRLGVTVKKVSPDMLMVIHLFSPSGALDRFAISNYAALQIRDVLVQIEGVGEVQLFGGRRLAMRVWLDPDKIAARDMLASEVVAAIRAQNLQTSAGLLNGPPTSSPSAFQINVEATGRLVEPRQFEDIVVKSDGAGRITRLGDVARVELAAQDYSTTAYLDHLESVPLWIFQQPGANALATVDRLKAKMKALSASFPDGLGYSIVYDPTEYIRQSIREVLKTIAEAAGLVTLIVIVFLRSWRTSLIPIVAIPISLIGALAILSAVGYSLNNLSLFGLVLAVGIVVDDAIVVVENAERHIARGLTPREAAHHTIDEVGGALVAIALTLTAVFLPTFLMSGIYGQFFRQFAVTIAASTLISLLVSLVLSPALCALLLEARVASPRAPAVSSRRMLERMSSRFDSGFDAMSSVYRRITERMAQSARPTLAIYLALIGLTAWKFGGAPTGFIPDQDQGYLITLVQLPPGSTLDRTDAVMREATRIIGGVPGVRHGAPYVGLDGATYTFPPNAGAIFVVLEPFEERLARGRDTNKILEDLRLRLSKIDGAFIVTIPPAPVPGLGAAGGFKMMVRDKEGHGLVALAAAARDLAAAADRSSELADVFSLFDTRTPKIFVDIDRKRSEMVGVPADAVADTLQIYLGSVYVNDFNYLGRTFPVVAQADSPFRTDSADIGRLKARNKGGSMVPLGSIVEVRETTGPYRVARYDLYPAAEILGGAAKGVSSSRALLAMETLARERLPAGFDFEWTDLSYQQKKDGDTTLLVFAASALFAFLTLAALYESWTFPLAIMLIAPMCLLAALTGLELWQIDVDILAQIGFVVLVGLAAKNAILIVEFARRAEAEGVEAHVAAAQAAGMRLRPILMTSAAFVLGVLPLAFATGAGAEMRQSLGVTVFAGMIGVTLFGLIFTPLFYVAIGRRRPRAGVGGDRVETC